MAITHRAGRMLGRRAHLRLNRPTWDLLTPVNRIWDGDRGLPAARRVRGAAILRRHQVAFAEFVP